MVASGETCRLRLSLRCWGPHLLLVLIGLLSMDVLALLNIGKHTQTTNRRDEARDNLLRHILGGGSQEVLKLDGAELFDDGGLFGDAVLEARFKFVQLALLLVEVLDEAATALLHLVETPLETNPVRCLVSLTMFDLVVGDGVLGVPDVVSYELLNLNFPIWLQIVVVDRFDFSHQSFNILDQDVVACDENTLLLPW